jgi:uncharacterized phage-associated protein
MATPKQVAECFLWLDKNNEGDGVSNLKLQKLTYYANGFFSAINDKPLFEEPISAWAHGPVIEDLYHEYKHHGSNCIPAPQENPLSSLPRDEAELIEEVFDVFGQYSAWKLRNMTHEEKPWLEHEANAGVIPQEEIKEYFKTRIK